MYVCTTFRSARRISDLQARFPQGAPSLIRCDRLRVIGDVWFGQDVVVEGDVTIANRTEMPLVIDDGAVLRPTQ